jgi:hypothetical protein
MPKHALEWTPFVLALSTTEAARRENGPYIQLSVGMCPECGALVAEDQAQLHEAFHARAGA